MGHESDHGPSSRTKTWEWHRLISQANPEYLAVNWESSGGGAFAVIPTSEKGRLPERIPLFRGHTAVVLDTDWWETWKKDARKKSLTGTRNPFNDSLIASGSDDGKVGRGRVAVRWQGVDCLTDH